MADVLYRQVCANNVENMCNIILILLQATYYGIKLTILLHGNLHAIIMIVDCMNSTMYVCSPIASFSSTDNKT